MVPCPCQGLIGNGSRFERNYWIVTVVAVDVEPV
jgi:hypothetical protein